MEETGMARVEWMDVGLRESYSMVTLQVTNVC